MVSKGVLKWSQKLGQLSKSLFGARATLVGKDALGNAYYKKMEYDPDLGVDKESRWMESPKGHDHVYNYDPNRTPVEWTGWLRGARSQPPTADEIEKNELYRAQVKAQVRQIKTREERRRRIKEEESAEKSAADPISIEEDSLDRANMEEVEYWKPGQ